MSACKIANQGLEGVTCDSCGCWVWREKCSSLSSCFFSFFVFSPHVVIIMFVKAN